MPEAVRSLRSCPSAIVTVRIASPSLAAVSVAPLSEKRPQTGSPASGAAAAGRYSSVKIDHMLRASTSPP